MNGQCPARSIVVSGNVGPRGDGYVAGAQMTVAEATEYHRQQIRVLAETGAIPGLLAPAPLTKSSFRLGNPGGG